MSFHEILWGIPYAELVKFFRANTAIYHTIQQMMKEHE